MDNQIHDQIRYLVPGVLQVDGCRGPQVPRVCSIIIGQKRLGFHMKALELVMPKQQRSIFQTFFEPLSRHYFNFEKFFMLVGLTRAILEYLSIFLAHILAEPNNV